MLSNSKRNLILSFLKKIVFIQVSNRTKYKNKLKTTNLLSLRRFFSVLKHFSLNIKIITINFQFKKNEKKHGFYGIQFDQLWRQYFKYRNPKFRKS
jgi:hypothetical protein